MNKRTKINNLNTINGLTAQMRSVYKIARRNLADADIDPGTCKQLVDTLKIIVAAQRDSELELRIAEIEAALK